MIEQMTGAASVAVLVLAYVLLVEAMMAAIVVLAHFTMLQWRSLWSLLAQSRPVVPVAVEDQDQGQLQGVPYVIGGNLRRWE